MPLVDNAIYVKGVRAKEPESLSETFDLMDELGGMAWIGLYRPTPEEVHDIAAEFQLHPLAIEDALSGHQRTKSERYGDVRFLVLRTARYIDETEEVEFGEVHVFAGKNFIVTIRHAETPNVGRVRARLEAEPQLLAFGPDAVLFGILDEIVDGYAPVVAGLENDIDEIEDQLFDGNEKVTRRIYELSREVIGFQRATQPTVAIVEALIADAKEINVELARDLRNVLDHSIRVKDRTDSFRILLDNALSVSSTVVVQQQNAEMRRMTEVSLAQSDQMKKVTSWAAILFAPTLISGIYGMNFTNMPELEWEAGYPLSVLAMVLFGFGLWAVFKKRGWL